MCNIIRSLRELSLENPLFVKVEPLQVVRVSESVRLQVNLSKTCGCKVASDPDLKLAVVKVPGEPVCKTWR